MTNIAIIAVAALIGLVRPFLPAHAVSLAGTYEAVAHLFIGGLCGAWLMTSSGGNGARDRALWVYVILGLSAIELACFLLKL
jgi:hypothetical protein